MVRYKIGDISPTTGLEKYGESDWRTPGHIGESFYPDLNNYYRRNGLYKNNYLSLSNVCVKALSYYKTEGHLTINPLLRTNLRDNLNTENSKYINAIDKGFKETKCILDHDLIVFRGGDINFTMSFLRLNVGDEFIDHGFPSCSLSKNVCSFFSDGDDEPLYLKMNIKKGTKIIPLSKSDEVENNEFEVLLNRGTKFKVLKKYKHNNEIIIEIENV